MKIKISLIFGSLLLSVFSYSATITDAVNSIDSKYNELLQKEETRKKELIAESEKLNLEIVNLKNIQTEKDKIAEKLRKDSEVRWHRDEYKKVLNQYEDYLKGVNKSIAEKEARVNEINILIGVID